MRERESERDIKTEIGSERKKECERDRKTHTGREREKIERENRASL